MPQEVLMIVEKASHRFRYYDIQTKQMLKQIPLADFPHELVVSEDLKYGYITSYGVRNSSSTDKGNCQVYVLEIATGTIVNTLTVADAQHGPMYRPHGVEVDKHGGVYVLSESGNRLFYKKNPLDGTTFDTSVPTGGIKGHLFALLKDGSRAFVTNLASGDVTAIAPHDPTVTPLGVETGKKPEGRCLSPDEKTLFITNRGDNTVSVIDVQSMALKFNFKTPQDPTRIFYDKKRNSLLVVSYLDKNMSIYSPQNGDLIYTFCFDTNPIALSFMNNDNWVVVPFMDNTVRVYDIDSRQQVHQFDTGMEPDICYAIPKSILKFG